MTRTKNQMKKKRKRREEGGSKRGRRRKALYGGHCLYGWKTPCSDKDPAQPRIINKRSQVGEAGAVLAGPDRRLQH